MCLGHVLVPERKEAIRNHPSFKKDKGANLKGLRRDRPSIESNNDSKW